MRQKIKQREEDSKNNDLTTARNCILSFNSLEITNNNEE
jgi:hypothetical protein